MESSGVWSVLIPALFIGSVQRPGSQCRKEGVEKRFLEGVVQFVAVCKKNVHGML